MISGRGKGDPETTLASQSHRGPCHVANPREVHCAADDGRRRLRGDSGGFPAERHKVGPLSKGLSRPGCRAQSGGTQHPSIGHGRGGARTALTGGVGSVGAGQGGIPCRSEPKVRAGGG